MIRAPDEVLLDEPEYIVRKDTIDLGEAGVMTFVHLRVFYFSAQMLKTMLRQWQDIRQRLPEMVFCMPDDPSDPIFDRFVSLFGWQLCREIPCTDGKVRKLYIHKDFNYHGRKLLRYTIPTADDPESVQPNPESTGTLGSAAELSD